MNPIYLESWNDVIKNLQKPLQKIYELNMNVAKEIKFIQIADLTQFKSPMELVEKQITYSIQNLHHVIDYSKQMSEILRQSMQPLAQSMKETTKTTLHRATAILEPSVRQSAVTTADVFNPNAAKKAVAKSKRSMRASVTSLSKNFKKSDKNIKKMTSALTEKKHSPTSSSPNSNQGAHAKKAITKNASLKKMAVKQGSKNNTTHHKNAGKGVNSKVAHLSSTRKHVASGAISPSIQK